MYAVQVPDVEDLMVTVSPALTAAFTTAVPVTKPTVEP